MPIRRFRSKPRRPRISRAIMARRRVRMSRPRQPIHVFKRTIKISDITASYNSATSSGVNISGAYVLSLDSLPNYTEFTNLYDQYKINGIKISFVPSTNSYITSGVSGVTAPNGFSRFSSALDFDDSTTPATENVLLQYGSLRTTPGWKTHSRYFKPKIREAAVVDTTTGALTAATVRSNVWLDCDRPDVEHYGLKVFCPMPVNTTVSASITYSVYVTMYMAFKNVR